MFTLLRITSSPKYPTAYSILVTAAWISTSSFATNFVTISYTSAIELSTIALTYVLRFFLVMSLFGGLLNVLLNRIHFIRAYVAYYSVLTIVILLSPVTWGLCEGWNVISLDTEAIFYTVFDILRKPVFGIIFL